MPKSNHVLQYLIVILLFLTAIDLYSAHWKSKIHQELVPMLSVLPRSVEFKNCHNFLSQFGIETSKKYNIPPSLNGTRTLFDLKGQSNFQTHLGHILFSDYSIQIILTELDSHCDARLYH